MSPKNCISQPLLPSATHDGEWTKCTAGCFPVQESALINISDSFMRCDQMRLVTFPELLKKSKNNESRTEQNWYQNNKLIC